MKIPIVIPLLFSAILLQGQNQFDSEGRRTGPWKVEYPEGGTLYEATFREGRPVGLMTRYYPSGEIKAKVLFSSGSNRNFTELFYQNGTRAAAGVFEGEQKDSVWTYYSEQDGSLRLKESYCLGKLHGKVRHYYSGGQISEELGWKEGLKEGSWIQYYEDGKLRLKASYLNNELHGPYAVYQPDGDPVVRGDYLHGMTHGWWSYYDENGSLADSLEFISNRAVDQKKYKRLMTEDSLLNKIPDEKPSTFLD